MPAGLKEVNHMLHMTPKDIKRHIPHQDARPITSAPSSEFIKTIEAATLENTPLSLNQILDTCGVDDTLWCLRILPQTLDNSVRQLLLDMLTPALAHTNDERLLAMANAATHQKDVPNDHPPTTEHIPWSQLLAATHAATAENPRETARAVSRLLVWEAGCYAIQQAPQPPAWAKPKTNAQLAAEDTLRTQAELTTHAAHAHTVRRWLDSLKQLDFSTEKVL